jgi:hypothetical protein
MSAPDLAASLHAAVDALLETDSRAVRYLEPPTMPAHGQRLGLARRQLQRLGALRALFPAVRTAARSAGYSARRAERRCKKLQAACVEEQHQTLEYLGAAWDMLPALSGEGADLTARLGAERAAEEVANIVRSSLKAQGHLAPWVVAVNTVDAACERVADLLAAGTPPAAPAATPVAPATPVGGGSNPPVQVPPAGTPPPRADGERQARQETPGPPTASAAPGSPAGRQACRSRDDRWLQWADEERLDYGAIRDRHNATCQQYHEAPIGLGRSGWDVVRKALERARARRERNAEP